MTGWNSSEGSSLRCEWWQVGQKDCSTTKKGLSSLVWTSIACRSHWDIHFGSDALTAVPSGSSSSSEAAWALDHDPNIVCACADLAARCRWDKWQSDKAKYEAYLLSKIRKKCLHQFAEVEYTAGISNRERGPSSQVPAVFLPKFHNATCIPACVPAWGRSWAFTATVAYFRVLCLQKFPAVQVQWWDSIALEQAFMESPPFLQHCYHSATLSALWFHLQPLNALKAHDLSALLCNGRQHSGALTQQIHSNRNRSSAFTWLA